MLMPEQHQMDLETDSKLRWWRTSFLCGAATINGIEDTIRISKRPDDRFPVAVVSLVLLPMCFDTFAAFASGG